MAHQFAIITFRADGPIKTWSDMRGANVHNARTKPIEHAVPGAPAPEHLIGSGDLVADVKARLRKVGIDPDRMRKNGVIAYEAIMTASPAFFDQGDAAAREVRLRDWTAAQVEFARKRYGAHRIASMVLHLDEKTPHIHLVVLPLEVKGDARRRDPADLRWGLVGRMISGPGQFDQLQDDYSAAMAPFGLTRGIAGSGSKNEPMARFIERTEREKVAAEQARAAAEAQRVAAADREREMLALMASASELQLEAEAERRAAKAEREKVRTEAAALASARVAMAAEREALDRDRATMVEQRDLLTAERAAARADRQAATAERAQLEPAMQKAAAFLDRMARMPRRDLHPAVQQAVVAANALRSTGVSMGAANSSLGRG